MASSAAAVACDRFVFVSGYPGTKELDQTALFYAARQGHANTIRRGQSKQMFKTFNYPGKRLEFLKYFVDSSLSNACGQLVLTCPNDFNHQVLLVLLDVTQESVLPGPTLLSGT